MASDGIGAGVAATLEVSLGKLAAVLDRQERRRQQMAAEISYIPGLSFPAFTSAVLPFSPGSGFGPRPGYVWAVQAIRVMGLATADVLTMYRGNSPTAAQPENALNTFTVAVAGAVSNWHPGHTGLLLSGQDNANLVFAGTLAGTATVNLDVIQVTDAQVPYLCL
jgi:hypothetical protein